MDKVIGKNLKAFRDYNRFTQEQVADYLSTVSRSAYSNYESGEREAPYVVLEKCADLYGCDLSQFFEVDEAKTKDSLSCAFRVDGLSSLDMEQIANFKSIVKNNLMLNELLGR